LWHKQANCGASIRASTWLPCKSVLRMSPGASAVRPDRKLSRHEGGGPTRERDCLAARSAMDRLRNTGQPESRACERLRALARCALPRVPLESGRVCTPRTGVPVQRRKRRRLPAYLQFRPCLASQICLIAKRQVKNPCLLFFPRLWVPDPENWDVRQLLWHRHRLVQMRTRVKNRSIWVYIAGIIVRSRSLGENDG